jgi:DnaJ-domain-containing protein 1
MDIDCRYDSGTGAAVLIFHYNGQKYERRSTNQSNAGRNLQAIKMNVVHKVIDHNRGIEDFGKSNMAYLAIEASPEDRNNGRQAVVSPTEINNAYNTLEVPEYASNDEIKRAYRHQCQFHHPDRFAKNNDPELTKKATNKLAEINAAWETIKRARGIE